MVVKCFCGNVYIYLIFYHAFTNVSLFIGMSESEQTMKGTSQIKILNAEEIEGMRVVCKVNQHHNLPFKTIRL